MIPIPVPASILRDALLLGLAAGAVRASSGQPLFKVGGALRFGGKLLGLLLGFAAAGFLLGLAGLYLQPGLPRALLDGVLAALAGFMAVGACWPAREGDGGALRGPLGGRGAGAGLLGLAALAAIRSGVPVRGMAVLLAFFAATWILPLAAKALPFLAALWPPPRIRQAARGLVLAAAFCFAVQSAAGLFGTETGAAEAFPRRFRPSAEPPPGPTPENEHLRQAVPGAERFRFEPGPPPYYVALPPEDADAPEKPLGFAFVCQWYMTPEKKRGSQGYGGPIHILLGADAEGRVLGMAVLEHRETPAFFRFLVRDEALAEYVGKTPQDEILPGVDLDVITGATFSQEGVAATVRHGLRGFVDQVLAQAEGQPAGAPDEALDAIPAWDSALTVGNAAFLLVLALGLAAFAMCRSAKGEIVLLLAAVGLLGAWLVRFFSVDDALRLAVHYYPAGAGGAEWWVTVGGVLAATLLFGRVFCRFFCPFGVLTELLWRPLRLRRRVPRQAERMLRAVPAAVLWGAALVYAAFGTLPAAWFEPFGPALMAMRRPAALFEESAVVVAVVLLSLAGAVVYRRSWCLYLCPAGAALRILSRLRLGPAVLPDRCRTCPNDPGEEINCPGCVKTRGRRVVGKR